MNARAEKLNWPKIENYEVKLQFRMPTNRIEEWQNIGNLDGIVSHKTQLELLSDIEDPDNEIENLRREGRLDAITVEEQLNEQAQRQAQLEGALITAQEQTTANIASVLDVVRQAMLKNATE